MNNKKAFIGVILLVAVLVLGVGYAVITNVDLKISGIASATSSDENFKVLFTGTPLENTALRDVSMNSTNVVVTPLIVNDNEAKLTVSGLTTTGDKVAATYTITNQSSELSASISPNSIVNDNSEYFLVTQTVDKTELAAGDSATITVVVELIKTPTYDVSATFDVPYVATPVQK